MMWASVDAPDLDPATAPPLMLVPHSVLIPVAGLKWEQQNCLEPTGGLEALSDVQQHALQQMLAIYAHTGKLADIQTRMPSLALSRDSSLAALLQAGHPNWVKHERSEIMATFLDTRVLNYSYKSASSQNGAPATGAQEILMPLIDLLNHHPEGSHYTSKPEGLRVKARTCGSNGECFARYGYNDAMMLLLHLGYVAREPRFVQSIACEIHADGFGVIRIQQQGHSNLKDLPLIQKNAESATISHLNLEADQPGHALKILTVVAQGLRIQDPVRFAQSAVKAVISANLDYYRTLIAQAQAAAHLPETARVGSMFIEVARHQMSLLEEIGSAAQK